MSGFVALDVETANAYLSSICQIGLAYFEDNAPPRVWTTYVNPRADFAPINVAIHGISPAMVRNAPTFSQLYAQLCRALAGRIVVHHTHFDRCAIKQGRFRRARLGAE